MRPVIVWITVVGLPLQWWGKDEVSFLTAPFGKLRKISANFFQKTSADAFKVMVEVDDISVVPKCDAANYSLYAEEGESGGYDEEGWSNGSEAEARGILRDALKQAAAKKEAGMVGAEAEIADPFPAEAQVQFTTAAAHEGGAVVQEQADVSAGERERRRKGKGILVEEGVKPKHAERILRASPQNSGSGSWDPLEVGAHQEHVGESLSSKDADSGASFEEVKGQELLPEEQAHRHDEDLDMGGEGAMGKQERPPREGGLILETGGIFVEVAPKKEKGKEVAMEAQLGGNM